MSLKRWPHDDFAGRMRVGWDLPGPVPARRGVCRREPWYARHVEAARLVGAALLGIGLAVEFWLLR